MLNRSTVPQNPRALSWFDARPISKSRGFSSLPFICVAQHIRTLKCSSSGANILCNIKYMKIAFCQLAPCSMHFIQWTRRLSSEIRNLIQCAEAISIRIWSNSIYWPRIPGRRKGTSCRRPIAPSRSNEMHFVVTDLLGAKALSTLNHFGENLLHRPERRTIVIRHLGY